MNFLNHSYPNPLLPEEEKQQSGVEAVMGRVKQRDKNYAT
jgi:hypothetical protein